MKWMRRWLGVAGLMGCLVALGAGAEVRIFGGNKRVVEVVVPVEAQPFDMAASGDGKRLYVTNAGGGKLTVLEDNKVARVAEIGSRPTGLAMNGKEDTLYVAVGNENVLKVVDAKTLEVKRKVAVGKFPIGVVLASDERFVVVTCADDETVHLISTATWEDKPLKVGKRPYFSILSKDEKYLLTANMNSNEVTVTQLEVDAGELKGNSFHMVPFKTVAVGREPAGLSLSLDGKKLYAANYGDGTVSVVSTGSWTVEETIKVGNKPYWIAVHPKDGTLLVSNYGSAYVDMIAPDGTRSQVKVENSVVKIYFLANGERAFSTDYDGGKVAVIE